MRAALMEGYESTTEFWSGIYGGLTALLGLRPAGAEDPGAVRHRRLVADRG